MPTQYGALKNGLRAYITYTLTTTATTYTLTITNAGIMAPAPIASDISLPAGDYTLSVRPYPRNTYVGEETLYRSAHTFAKGNVDRWQQVFTSDTLITKSYSGTLNKTAYGGGDSEVGVSIRIRRDTSPVYQTLASIPIPTKAKYTVSYNANGGSGAPSTQTKWHDETLTLSSTRPTRTGYTFAGWATSAGGSVAYQPSGSYTANSAVTLYAKWNIITYTVSYNANGGTGAPANQTKYYGTNLVLSSTVPTRVGYTFKNWNTKADGTGTTYNAGSTYTGNAALALYAQWEQVGKVTLYDANGNPHTGRVYLYDENGNKLNCSIWVYDENGNRHYTK